MAIDLDDEILQDFLVEAGELLEQLSEQLVELEQSPHDTDLLNAVFRAFHTVKGGAGFINLTAMVELCHRAEDVFNLLRQGEREVDADLMDAVLKSLDTLNAQFDEVRNGEDPSPADEELLGQLEAMMSPPAAVAEPAAVPEPESVEPAGAESPASSGDITDDEFEHLLDSLQGNKKTGSEDTSAAPAAEPAKSSGEITDDEFDKLLDELHGGGKVASGPPKKATPAAPLAASTTSKADDSISDDEFDDLLDSLHGKGKKPGEVTKADEPVAAAKKPAAPDNKPATPAPAVAAKAAAGATKAAAAPKKDAPSAKPQIETSVRVDTKRLDEIMNLVGELVLVRNRLNTIQLGIKSEALAKTVSNLDTVTSDIQAGVMKTRMQPIKKVFGRFPRVVRDLARTLKKEVNLKLVGEETDLDKNLVEALADPLVHLVRNAVDHGVEMPHEREAAGKSRIGEVVLSAKQAGDHILITIEDDGKGMDADVLRNIAVNKNLMSADAAARLSDTEAYNLIFAPGFSTKEQISDISGRGVGMDVVKTRITQLNGSVDITSNMGTGSKLSIKLPLTLAILPTLMIVLGNQRFALPLSSVRETYELDLRKTSVIDEQEVLLVRNRPLPLFYLNKWLSPDSFSKDKGVAHQVVVVQVSNQNICFVVDELLGQEEVVIKPLGMFLKGLPGFAGATITGDGLIALILDIPTLLGSYARAS